MKQLPHIAGTRSMSGPLGEGHTQPIRGMGSKELLVGDGQAKDLGLEGKVLGLEVTRQCGEALSMKPGCLKLAQAPPASGGWSLELLIVLGLEAESEGRYEVLLPSRHQ